MEYQYKIRPHHGMCIAYFQGKGYNNEFTAHMSEMIHKLEKNPMVCITTQTDAICLKCPHNIQGICVTDSKVVEYDKQVRQRCNWIDGIILPYMDFKKSIYEKILLPGRRTEICGDCQWSGICHFNVGGKNNE